MINIDVFNGFCATHPYSTCTSGKELVDAFKALHGDQLLQAYRAGREAAKRMLPCICLGKHIEGAPHTRADKHYEMGHRLCFDVDVMPPYLSCAGIADRLKGYFAHITDFMDYVVVEESASGGCHIYLPIVNGIRSDIRAYFKVLHLIPDYACSNTSRIIAMTNILHGGTSYDALFRVPPQEMIDALREMLYPDGDDNGGEDTKGADKAPTTPITHNLDADLMELVVDFLIEGVLGGLPCEGSRNSGIYKLACHLYPLLQSADLMLHCLERHHYFGLSEAEARCCINSACRRLQDKGDAGLERSDALRTACMRAMTSRGEYPKLSVVYCDNDEIDTDSYSVSTDIQLVSADDNADVDVDDNTDDDADDNAAVDTDDDAEFDIFGEVPPEMPPLQELPGYIRLILKGLPPKTWAHVIVTLEPLAHTYLLDAWTVGLAGSTLYLGSGAMAISAAPMCSGKSSRNLPLKFLKSRLLAEDAASRLAIEEWKSLPRSERDSQPRPKHISHICGSDASSASLVKRLKELPEGALYIDCDEISMLCALSTNSSEPHTPLLLAYDRQLQTVERSSEDSVDGCVEMRLNLSAQGTQMALNQYIGRNGWVNGLITRLNFATIIDDPFDESEFVYKPYPADYQEKLDVFIDRLCASANQEIHCPKLDEFCRDIQRRFLAIAKREHNEVLRIAARRQSLNIQRAAYLYYILEGKKLTARLRTFIEWRANYSLWALFYCCGRVIEEQQKQMEIAVSASKRRGPASTLSNMPEEVTLEVIAASRAKEGKDADITTCKKMISTWVGRGLLVPHPDKKGVYVNKLKV